MHSCDTLLRTNTRLVLWGFLLVVLSFVLHIKQLPYAEDDAYIHMRIARHLWATGYPYFNHGEPVMASTAPLWLLVSAPAAILGSFQPFGVACLNVVALSASSWVWGLVFTQSTGRSSSIPHAGALLLTFVTLAPSSISLMETPLAMMLTGVAYLGVWGKKWWGVPAITLAPFVRPECIVFAATLLLYRFYSKRPWSTWEITASIVPVVLLSGFDLYFFGSVIPHTAHVKDVVYEISSAEFIKFFCLGSYGSFITKNILPFSALALGTGLVALIMKLDLKKVSLRDVKERISEPPLMFLILAPATIIFVLYAIKHVLVFPWYTSLILVPVYLGFLALLKSTSHSARAVSMSILVPVVSLGALLAGSCIKPELAPFFESGARARQLRMLGAFLYSAYPGARVMAPEIGALGFSFKGRVVDAIGLASPEALTFHPMKVPEQRPAGFLGSVPAALVDKEKPEIMVGLKTFFTHVLTTEIVDKYDIIERSAVCQEDLARAGAGMVFGSRQILVFRRKGLTSPEATDIFAPSR